MFKLNCNIKRIVLALILLFTIFPAINATASEHEDSEKFDVKAVIFHHLLDSYYWEVPLTTAKVYLPIIVKDNSGEWHIFSSSRVDGDKTYKGFTLPHHGEFAGKVVAIDKNGAEYRPVDLSITKNVSEIILAALIILLLFIPAARGYKKAPFKAPRSLKGVLELFVDMIYGEVIKPILGKKARKFAPYLLTVFFFILVMNLLGMVTTFPGGANLTGNISVTLVLSVVTFLVINIFGTKHYWKELFWPEVPTWMKCPIPLMPVIEIFGALTKPVALMIRLFANMLGGHMITLVLVCLIFIFSVFGVAVQGGTAVFSVAFALFMGVLHLLISVIQAYVFTMLATIFISLAQEEGHAEHKETKETK